MRGPGLRLKGDVRRTWRCRACGSELRAGGDVTSLRCTCEQPGPFMRLVEPRRRSRPEAEPLDVYFECAPDDETDTAAVSGAEAAVPASIEQADIEAVSGDGLEETPDVVAVEETSTVMPSVPTPEEVGPTDSAEEQPGSPTETAPAEPSPAETGKQTAETDESGKPQQKRRRRSRGGRRKRGRGRKSAGGGPKNRPGGPDS